MKLLVAIDGMCGNGTFTSSSKWQRRFQDKICFLGLSYQLKHEPFFYLPWQKRKIRQYVISILEEYDKVGNELILFGHSIGGLVARDVASKFKLAKVTVVATHCCPLNVGFLWGLQRKHQSKELNFVDVIDPIVWSLFSIRNRRNTRFCRPTLHFLFLHPSKRMVTEILKSTDE